MLNSKNLLENLQNQTERHLQKAIADWQNLPPALLAAAPAAGKWSAAQCLEHLNFYGKFYLPAIAAAIEQARATGRQTAENFQPGWLGGRFTKMMLPQHDGGGGLKNKMSAPKNARPAAAPDPVATLAEFIEQREKMLGLLAAAAAVDLNSVRVPISIARWLRLKLGDVLMFMTAHDFRHLLQAERAVAQAAGRAPVFFEMIDFQ
ncbi:MAG: DinB family protein [Saprospiraceae bacterium]